MNVATWNVRALLDRDESRNAERRTAIVARELARYNVDIAALSETRLSGENQLSEKGAGYTFFWKGKTEGEKRERGVGFATRTEIIKQLEQPYGVSDRIMCPRASLSCGRFITVISVYAPTLGSNQESIMAFYQDLRNCISSIPNADKILLLGDFNVSPSTSQLCFHMHFKIVTLGYSFALEPLAKSSTFVVSIPSRKLFSRLSENSCSQTMHISLPTQKKTCS